MENNMSLSDIAAVTNGTGMGGNSLWILIVLFLLIGLGGNGFNRGGDYGQYATAASQQDILFSSKFENLDNKIDRIGNGIADATFSLNNAINGVQSNLGGAITAEGRAISDKLCNINTAIHAEGEATRSLIQQNKIETLQNRINQLEMQSAMCGVVKYPMASTYNAGNNPFCGCNCNGGF